MQLLIFIRRATVCKLLVAMLPLYKLSAKQDLKYWEGHLMNIIHDYILFV